MTQHKHIHIDTHTHTLLFSGNHNHYNSKNTMTSEQQNDLNDITRRRLAAGCSTELDGTVGGNRSYNTQIATYKKYIDNRLLHGGARPFHLQPTKYINKTALETYFLDRVSARNCNANTAKQTVNALDKLVQFEGILALYPLSETMASTIQAVFGTLNKRKAEKIMAISADPHKHIPVKILAPWDLSAIMEDILASSSQGDTTWKDRGIVWSLLSNTMMRWNNGAKTTLACLYVYKKLPPAGVLTPHDTFAWEDPTKDDRHWMMSIIIPPRDQIKKNDSISDRKSELVAAYRHKRYERCIAGLIAFKLYEDLNGVINISFMTQPPAGHIFWANMRLFQETYMTTYRGMQRDQRNAAVEEGRKKTHLR